MKINLKFIIFVVLLSLLSTVIISCTPSEEAEESKQGETTSKSELFGNLPEKKYDGEEIVILVEGDYMTLSKSVEICEHEDSPDIINTAVADRNALVEEEFGVKITEQRTENASDMSEKIRNNELGGSDLYDIVMPYIPQAATLSLDGYFYLLNDLENVHLDEPYWDQGSIVGLSINNKNYFATGDFSLLSLACTHAIVFNKDLIDENSLDNPYDLVNDGEWTIDKLREMAKIITNDTDGESGMSFKDTYGFLVNSNFVTSMFVGSGEHLTGKDSDDMPYISVSSEKGVSVFNKIYDLVTDQKATGHIEDFEAEAKAEGKTHWLMATEAVADKRALFRAMCIADIPELGGYECNFGILPIPKYDEAQEDHHSLVSTIYASSAAIPTANSNVEQASIILDALCQASTDTVKYNYYQVMLKDRKIQDYESEAMLDLIFDNRLYDLGVVFGWGGQSVYDNNSIANFMNSVAFSGSNTFVSTYESIKGKIQSDLEKTVDISKK